MRVTPAAERALRNGHPWLFTDAITKQSHTGHAGDLAIIFDRKGRFLAVGLYDPDSIIRVRVLQQGQSTPINLDWYKQTIGHAVTLRRPLKEDPHTNGYRLIHGENDGLPGVIIDRYGRTYVIKLYSKAWVIHLPLLLNALQHHVAVERVVLRLNRAIQTQVHTQYNLTNGTILHGPPITEPIQFRENGLRFEVDVIDGQKTGFFLDQRDNRMRVERLSQDKKVLNVFAYTGAFSLYAARGGAKHIISVDSSQPALATAVTNFRLNQASQNIQNTNHELIIGDAFRALKELKQNKRTFDLIIIDPPSFAKSKDEINRALTAYGRLVRLGLDILRRNGVFVMCSCSSRISNDDFFKTVQQTAHNIKRPLRPIERTSHALDHPTTFPEGNYLKALFAHAP